jgi:putative FmdB family regulatory protein
VSWRVPRPEPSGDRQGAALIRQVAALIEEADDGSDKDKGHNMPTYEYQCKTCGAVMEVFQSITAKALKKHECQTCGKTRAVERLIGTGSALIFKGSGFYQTDYRSENYTKAAKAESDAGKPAKDPAGKSDSTGADKTPAAKSETKSETKSDSKSSEGGSKKKKDK